MHRPNRFTLAHCRIRPVGIPWVTPAEPGGALLFLCAGLARLQRALGVTGQARRTAQIAPPNDPGSCTSENPHELGDFRWRRPE
jgi:hypothetical protein